MQLSRSKSAAWRQLLIRTTFSARLSPSALSWLYQSQWLHEFKWEHHSLTLGKVQNRRRGDVHLQEVRCCRCSHLPLSYECIISVKYICTPLSLWYTALATNGIRILILANCGAKSQILDIRYATLPIYSQWRQWQYLFHEKWSSLAPKKLWE
jgi:hypothetical protein